jgi:hypothetical protein
MSPQICSDRRPIDCESDSLLLILSGIALVYPVMVSVRHIFSGPAAADWLLNCGIPMMWGVLHPSAAVPRGSAHRGACPFLSHCRSQAVERFGNYPRMAQAPVDESSAAGTGLYRVEPHQMETQINWI